jgi:glycine/D-amino acid oxidase-like deaminating enzyme
VTKAAVIGAGFCGLALATHLLAEGLEVHLYDQKGIGAGASGVASGLLHPYAGEGAKRSFKACKALEETKKLLRLSQSFSTEKVADFSGIIRRVSPEQGKILLRAAKEFGDIIPLSEDSFDIASGITVHSQAYLQGLFSSCFFQGMQLKIQRIHAMDELSGYDFCFFAVGSGVFFFPEMARFSLKPVKGQALVCKWPEAMPLLQKSMLGKGYIVPKSGRLVYLGSTYERDVCSDTPCLFDALLDLKDKARELVPEWDPIDALECRAAVRVSRLGHYFPLLEKISNNVWALSGVGSRGLLYHAYAAKILVQAALQNVSPSSLMVDKL